MDTIQNRVSYINIKVDQRTNTMRIIKFENHRDKFITWN